ncbi:MAG: mitochondrial fission ELM1 family protein [Rhodanobacter sp.]
MPKLQDECWVITDTAAGNQRQALALAGCLPWPARLLILEPRAPWSWLAPRLTVGGLLALPAAQRQRLTAPWPRVAIGCGRAAALFTRMLRSLSAGSCYTVQILDPRSTPDSWDTVIAPQHDQLSGPNVLQPLGSLNPIDDAWLADGRAAYPALGELARPRVGVLLGGPRRGIPLDVDYAQRLANQLLARQQHNGGSLLLLGSRRTPTAVANVFRERLRGVPGLLWCCAEDGPNPYPAVLGWADQLVVTPDSVNMLSEACAVGCPVSTFVTSPLPTKLQRFHQSLHQAGLLHDLGNTAPSTQAPLRETAAIAKIVLQRIASAQAQ